MSFKDKAIIVFGGGRGLGFQTALRLLQQGAKVALVDMGCDTLGQERDASVVEAAAVQLRQISPYVMGLDYDVTVDEELDQAFQDVQQHWAKVDSFIYAAGIYPSSSLIRTPLRIMRKAVETHLIGAWRALQIGADHWIEQQISGSAVLLGGAHAFLGAQRQTVLAATQAALFGMVRSAAAELRKHEIKVNVVAPFAKSRANDASPLLNSTRPDSFDDELIVDTTLQLLHHENRLTGEILGVAGRRIYTFRVLETPGVHITEPSLNTSLFDQKWPEIVKPY